jgi:hypothetical protein
MGGPPNAGWPVGQGWSRDPQDPTRGPIPRKGFFSQPYALRTYRQAASFPAAKHTRALVSGYASRHRARKVMVVLEAYIDESASELGDKQLFLAGYVSTAALWTRFSNAWERELHSHPRIEYLHMADAQNLRGQFQGWSEADRDRKVVHLANVIPSHVVCSIQVSVSRVQYEQIIEPIAPYNLKNPYFLCFVGVIYKLAQTLDGAMRDAPPIVFIFDDHSLGPDAAMWYDYLKDRLPPGPRKLLGGPPIFRDDKKVPPLQSADMLAWHLRREAELRDQVNRPALSILLSGGYHVVAEVDKDQLERQANEMRRIPGIGSAVRSKREWQKVRRSLAAHMAAGRAPPSINLMWLYLLYVSTYIYRAIKKVRRRGRKKR